jgi:hypothetical protein
MKGNRAFWRIVAYVTAIALLLVPLSYLSRPATTEEDSGGWLAQLRERDGLSLAQLGEIDPAGSSMSLATLGMRGVAATMLWNEYLYAKKTEQFGDMKAAINQIVKLYPHFTSVWRFQSWDLAYNIPAEFDDYRHRYHWVKKGFDFLMQGIRYNRDEPMLRWEAGWFFGHKLGRSDDRRQFRQLFRKDDDFHRSILMDIEQTRGVDGYPDNWLAAWLWYRAAQQIVDTKNVPVRGKNTLVFHSDPALALIYYAIATIDDGHLDEKGQKAWRRADEAWQEFGNRHVPTRSGQQVRLNDLERFLAEAQAAREKLDQLLPSVRQELIDQRKAKLTDLERQALATPILDRSTEQMELATNALRAIAVSHREVAEQAPPEKRAEALALANQAMLLEAVAQMIDNFRTTVNFEYWRTRCEAEQQDATIQARKFLAEADQAYGEAKLEEARKLYEQAWDAWASIYQQYPILMDDTTAESVFEATKRYGNLLGKLDEKFPPPDFPLHQLLELHDPSYQAAPTQGQHDAETEATRDRQQEASPADPTGQHAGR